MEKVVFTANEIWDIDEIPFDQVEYSKFKFGSKSIARKYGKDLATKFWKRVIRDSGITEQFVVYSSPYNYIPTATGIMKDYFIRYFNEYLLAKQLPPLEEGRIFRKPRTTPYSEDYGTMDAEQRLKWIGDDRFYVDAEFAKGKVLLFLDDVKITGSHEIQIDKMCEKYGIENKCFFLYFAALKDPSIPAQFENDLNYAFVKNLLDINWILRNDEFIPNTRVVKYILNSNPSECRTFFQYQSERFLDNIWHLAIGNSYHLLEEYKQNLETLKSLLD